MGDLLLSSNKYADAIVAYGLQLERSRQKSRTLLGLAQAQAALENEAEARYTREKLERIWSNADSAVKEQN